MISYFFVLISIISTYFLYEIQISEYNECRKFTCSNCYLFIADGFLFSLFGTIPFLYFLSEFIKNQINSNEAITYSFIWISLSGIIFTIHHYIRIRAIYTTNIFILTIYFLLCEIIYGIYKNCYSDTEDVMFNDDLTEFSEYSEYDEDVQARAPIYDINSYDEYQV